VGEQAGGMEGGGSLGYAHRREVESPLIRRRSRDNRIGTCPPLWEVIAEQTRVCQNVGTSSVVPPIELREAPTVGATSEDRAE